MTPTYILLATLICIGTEGMTPVCQNEQACVSVQADGTTEDAPMLACQRIFKKKR